MLQEKVKALNFFTFYNNNEGTSYHYGMRDDFFFLPS